MRNLFTAAGLSLLAVAACTADQAAPKAPPVLKVTSPERGTMRSDLGTVEVRGTVTPAEESETPIQSVVVNGVPAAVAADGSFVADVAVYPGATLINTVATDADGNQATDTRAVEAGDMTSPGATIADGITAAVSADAFAKMGDAAANIMAGTDMAAILAPMNPVMSVGADQGEDCLWMKASVNDFQFADPSISLVPVAGGLHMDMQMWDVSIPMFARYAVACLDGSDDITLSASRVEIAGDLAISASNGKLIVSLSNSDVTLDGFNIDAGGLPGAVLDMINLDGVVEWMFNHGAEKFMEPMLNKMLPSFAGVNKSMDLMGHTLDIAAVPGDIAFDSTGMRLRMDTAIAVAGDSSKGFIYTENGLPAMDTSTGLEIGIADDVANQVLAGFTAVGGVNLSLPVDGGAFDAAQATATLPPMISADPASGALRLYVPDLMLDFNYEGKSQARAALNLILDLNVVATADGMTIAPGKPEVHVDMVDDVVNNTGFRDADLASIVTLVVNHEVGTLGPLLGAIPVPGVGGVSIQNLGIAGNQGYVTVTGALAE